MKRPTKWMVFGVAWALAGCDRDPQPTNAPTNAPSNGDAQALPADVIVRGTGSGASEDEAYEAASEDLAKAMFVDPAWVRFVPVVVHDRARDPVVVSRSGARIDVALGLTRGRAAEVMRQFEVTDPELPVPSLWRDSLLPFATGHVAAHACERRRALFGVQCEPPDLSDVNATVARMGQETEVVLGHADGIPVDDRGHPLRRLQAYVLWRGVPMQGVPVAMRSADEAPVVREWTSAQGLVEFEPALDAPWRGARLTIDTAALVGPLHVAWPTRSVPVPPRSVDLRRWSAVVIDGERGVSNDGPLQSAIGERLRDRGFGQPVAMPAERARSLAQVRPDGRRAKVIALADALAGRLDVLLWIEIDSEFASRMGSSRVWYEAKGTLTAHHVWTGEPLCTIEASARGSGVGEQRADEAARRALGEALVAKLLEHPGVPMPKRTSAAVAGAAAASAGSPSR